MVARSASIADHSGIVYVQAFRPEREALTHIAGKSVASLLEKTARDREALRYPPYHRIFRIVFRDKSEELAEKYATEAYDRLAASAGTLRTIRVAPPMKPLIPKVRGRYERIILVTGERTAPFPPELERILLSEPKVWTFDPDPLSLL
jgi:primosomal protein N' (replication factor Y)